MDLLESENSAFCYMIRVDKQNERKLIELQKELGLKGKLIEKDDFHTTIRYIKTSKSPDLLLGFLAGAKLPVLKGRLKGFDIFGQEKDALVLKVESKEITDWFTRVNKFLVDNNYPKSEYPIYRPHITLTYDKGIEKPKWRSKYEMEIKFTIHVVSNKQEKLIFNKDATKQTLRESIVKVFMEADSNLDAKLKQIMTKWEAEGVESFISTRNGDITLHQIVIPKQLRGKGLGTEKIKELQQFAQENNLRILLSPDTSYGATSKARLEKFYSGLGFVRNKGRNKDYRVSHTMIWRPQQVVKETPVWDDAVKDTSKRENGFYPMTDERYLVTKQQAKQPKKVVKYKDFNLELYDYKTPYNHFIKVFAILNKKPIAQLACLVDKEKYPVVAKSGVGDEFQGQGIGYAMYKMIIEMYGGLISDQSLTGEEGKGSFDIWTKLSKEYTPYIRNEKVKEITRNDMGQLDRFMVIKENPLTESPIWDEKHREMGKFITDDGLDYSIQSTKESSFFKKRFRIGEYTIELREGPDNHRKTIHAFLYFQKKPIGELIAQQNPNDKFPVIGSIWLKEEHKGKGIGLATYKALVETYGGLISDSGLTGQNDLKGSFGLWRKLGQFYNKYIIRKGQIEKVNDFSTEYMNDKELFFMVSKKVL